MSEQLERCGVDYFDFYLLHAMNTERDLKLIQFCGYELVNKLKAEGKIKHLGFSFHGDNTVLEKVLSERPEMEFVQIQLNYIDWDDIGARGFYEIVRKHNKPVIIMEPVKGGTLANLPKNLAKKLTNADPAASAASWAFRYCASLDGVMTILSGMSNIEQMTDNISVFKNIKPLTESERNVLAEVAEGLRSYPTVGCTECKYCSECPLEIPIFDIFKDYNKFVEEKSVGGFKKKYEKLAADKRPDVCIKCGNCESVCPQNIEIIDKLEYIANVYKEL